MDSVEFYIVTNRGEQPKPLAKIASGGELSRIMLALKNALADSDDIGTVKIPKAIRKLSGADVEFVFDRTADSVDDCRLVVQCGSCMLTRREVLRRIEQARAAGIPVVNYGMVLAKAAGLDKSFDFASRPAR